MVDEYVWDKYFINCTSEFLWTVVSRGEVSFLTFGRSAQLYRRCRCSLCGALLFSKLVRHTVLKCFRFCSKMIIGSIFPEFHLDFLKVSGRWILNMSETYISLIAKVNFFEQLWAEGEVSFLTFGRSAQLYRRCRCSLCGALLFSKLVRHTVLKCFKFCSKMITRNIFPKFHLDFLKIRGQ